MRHNLRGRVADVVAYLCVAAVAATALGLAVGWFNPGHASVQLKACPGLHTQPQSPEADYCRDNGWHLTGRLVVSPHGVVRYTALPHCPWEDGGENQPCTWNIGRKVDGNGKGLSYWIDREDRVHYVWPINPVRSNVGPPIHWVGTQLADALAEGVVPHNAGTRHWERCITNGRHHRHITVVCPDGWKQTD